MIDDLKVFKCHDVLANEVKRNRVEVEKNRIEAERNRIKIINKGAQSTIN